MSQSFGRYRLLEVIGVGGMALVYRATIHGQKGVDQELVIKRILPSCASDPAFVSMLVTEARLYALSRHPNIVRLHELGEVDGEHFLAMEYVDGHDLAVVLRRCATLQVKPPMPAVLHIVCELLSALSFAHRLKDGAGNPLEIVHRDVTPSNIMITANGGVKLLDFGIAKAADQVRDERTRSGVIKGKLSYCSPEQALGQPVDARADLFALGIILHECLSARRLFRGDDDLQTLERIREMRVPAPSELRSEVPPELDALALRMLARDRDQRHPSCEAVLDELRPIAHRMNADAGALERFLVEIGPIESKRKELAREEASGKLNAKTARYSAPPNRPWRKLVAGGLVVGGLAVGGIWAARTPPTAAAPAVAPLPMSAPLQPKIVPPSVRAPAEESLPVPGSAAPPPPRRKPGSARHKHISRSNPSADEPIHLRDPFVDPGSQ